MQANYGIIVGTGRCGSNWLLTLCDYSPDTNCRNEPDEIPTSRFTELPEKWYPVSSEQLEHDWDEIASSAARHIGVRDHIPPGPKRYYHRFAVKTGLAGWPHRGRLAAVARFLYPPFRSGEWSVPGWLGQQRRLDEAFGVLKILSMTGWAAWLLSHRPSVPIVHIVRHPAGTMNSYRKRYLAYHDEESVARVNRERLERVLELRPDWRERCSDVRTMGITESELWFWRYATQTLHEAGAGHPNYKLVIYENLAADPLGVSRSVYDHFGLEWTPRVERLVAESGQGADRIASAWKRNVTDGDLSIMDRILTDSPLAEWWETLLPSAEPAR